MLGIRKAGVGVLLAALAAAALGPAGAAQAAPDPGGRSAAPAQLAGSGRTVTLVTGDRVTVHEDGRLAVHRSDDRRGITFLTHRIDGHLHVVPSDAVPLLRTGRLDSRLFDVTALIEFGYDDRRGDLPLIVTAGGVGARTTARATVTAEGATVVRELPAVGGLAVRADKERVDDLWRSLTGSTGAGARALSGGVTTVWLDGLRQPSLDVSVPQIGAPAAGGPGERGAGVKVAVLDTGIDATHPDLAGQVGAARNFTEGEEDDLDRVGHGTHVASTIAGTGAASGGRYVGVAPAATLLDGKVCVEYGCADSWILAGMQWAAEQGAAVVNMSLGGWDTPEQDPVEQAVENLTEQYGTLFVVAAGNAGMDASIDSPASADAALAVGAVDADDELADFSSRGPRIDGGLKPDITAPGAEITAANSKDGFLGTPGEPYTTIGGTSMATPHVAGAAAILAQRHPGSTPAQLKAMLMGSAKPHPQLSAFAQGAGRVDVARAISQSVTTDPPSVGFGRQLWPHHDDTPVARTITYGNAGSAAITLSLSARGTGPTGEPAPAGFFTVSADSVTVPAGGTASVTVTADTRVDGPDGYYTGRLVATADGVSVTTPFAVDREVESYDVRLRHTGRDGRAPAFYVSTLMGHDAFGTYDAFGEDGGAATVRVPKGTYSLMSVVATEIGEEEYAGSFLVHPQVAVTGDRTLTVDARRARPMSITTPRAGATALGVDVIVEVTPSPDYAYGYIMGDEKIERLSTAQLGPDRSYDFLHSAVSTTFVKLDADGTALNTPYSYLLAWHEAGRVPTGFTRAVKPGQLATVRAHHATQGPAFGVRYTFPNFPNSYASVAYGLPMDLPFQRTDYFNTADGVRWQGNFDEINVTEEGEEYTGMLWGAEKRYQAGRTYTEHWNRGVFGPSLVDPVIPEEYVSRQGDTLFLLAPTHSDGESRYGATLLESARTTVYRDGEKVTEVADAGGVFEVPARAGRYRVEVDARRGAPATLSTRVSTAWEFRSGHVRGDEARRLPVSVVRFAPDLSGRNTAPAGRAYQVPVTVQRQPDSGAKPCRSLTVEVSYDDGRTWHRAKVTGSGADRTVHLRHPDRDGFVSLRASATDTAGNTVQQTIIRAYRIVR